MSSTISAMTTLSQAEQNLVDEAIRHARDTKMLVVKPGVRHSTAHFFRKSFSDSSALIVADRQTFAVAGSDVLSSLRREGVDCLEPFLFPDHVYAESEFVAILEQRLSSTTAIPVAVGSGTINDLTKLAAFRQGRQYLAIATAASMDGYTAYGASITHRGSKQTFDCPAPQVVLADLEVITSAPPSLNASGYSDLLAKGAAGVDWILADQLGEEPIHSQAWTTVQEFLPSWVDSPQGVRKADPESLRRLVVGLMMSGFAMQAARSSRPASGAEHQFSHLWDMQHHTFQGVSPSHGFKVGIGTCASLNLYRVLLKRNFAMLDIDRAVEHWPSLPEIESRIRALLEIDELVEKGIEESRAKYRSRDDVREQLNILRNSWPELYQKLNEQIQPFEQASQMLQAAGSPSEPEQIGISRRRLRTSFEQAFFIRRRFTILDFVMRTGQFDLSMEELFGRGGIWAIEQGMGE